MFRYVSLVIFISGCSGAPSIIQETKIEGMQPIVNSHETQSVDGGSVEAAPSNQMVNDDASADVSLGIDGGTVDSQAIDSQAIDSQANYNDASIDSEADSAVDANVDANVDAGNEASLPTMPDGGIACTPYPSYNTSCNGHVAYLCYLNYQPFDHCSVLMSNSVYQYLCCP